jgi:glycosyltransferase involved in cell wall biosynthesis
VAARSLNPVRQRGSGRTQLAVISTHPVQYHAPVYREIQRLGLPVTAIYGSDFSVAGYHDHEFDVAFSWSTDLLSGYSPVFLSRVADGGATTAEATSSRGLTKALSQIAPDAVLLTGYWPAYLRQAALQLLVHRQRILFRAETADHARERAWLKGSARDLVLRQFYEKCCALIYIGKRSREHFERLGAGGREMFFSPYCVDASAFEADEASRERLRASTRAELGLRSDQIVLVFAGKLIHRKGPDLLLDAIQELPAELRGRLAIVFLGDGEMRTLLADRADTITLRFVGFQNQHQLSRYYHACDALVLPSRSSETWGLVVNEALLHGLPCLVSAGVGCALDLVASGETGEIFETNSAASLREGLGRLLAWRQDDAETRERCRQRVKHYSVSVAAKGIIAAFEATMSEGATARGTGL